MLEGAYGNDKGTTCKQESTIKGTELPCNCSEIVHFNMNQARVGVRVPKVGHTEDPPFQG